MPTPSFSASARAPTWSSRLEEGSLPSMFTHARTRPPRGAVELLHHFLERLERARRVAEVVMRKHLLGPALGCLLGPHVGGVASGYAAHADLVDRLHHALDVVVGAHVEEAGGPRSAASRPSRASSPPPRPSRRCGRRRASPSRIPSSRVGMRSGNTARESVSPRCTCESMSPGSCPAPAVDDRVEGALRRFLSPDLGEAIVLDNHRGVPQHPAVLVHGHARTRGFR